MGESSVGDAVFAEAIMVADADAGADAEADAVSACFSSW